MEKDEKLRITKKTCKPQRDTCESITPPMQGKCGLELFGLGGLVAPVIAYKRVWTYDPLEIGPQANWAVKHYGHI